MRRATLLAILVTAVLAGSVSADSFQNQILWMDREHTEALFIPEAVSHDLELSELPIDRFDRSSLSRDLHDKLEGAPCIVRRGRDKQGSSPSTVVMSQLFELPEIIFVGRVVDVVEGWNSWRRVIGRMAYVEITEMIRPEVRSEQFSPGHTVAVFFEGGETTVAGVELCFEPGTGAHVPSAGDTLLVGGVGWDNDDRHFNAFVKFPVVAGRVLPQPYAELKRDARSTSLKDLLREIRAAVRRDPN